jgi:F-type H+/Na+-transporting ATPase subunit alpha
MTIYAVTNGHIDDVPVNRVREWERQFQEFLAARHPKILEKLRTEKALSKDTEAELKGAIAAFKQTFK